MFIHCFTCTKDLKAIVKISRQLALRGIAVARFDFTGLGDSSGNFSETNFETNVADVLSVAQWLGENYESPRLLMGLSLGGAAMMVASSQLSSVNGLVTIAAPSCTRHLAEFLVKQSPEIETEGVGTVVIGGRNHTIKPQLLNSLRQRDLEREIAAVRAHHLILHSPQDETLGFYHAENIFRMSGGIKSFVTLDGCDHLLMNRETEIEFVANLIDLWSQRWIA
jgi:putative redox protein